MRAPRALQAILAALVGSIGCGGDDTALPAHAGPPTACAPGERLVDGKGCLAAGVQDSGCAAGELTLEDGSCRPAGIAPERCGDGFEPDGEAGCNVILPRAACPPGRMAVPGETACREVAPCGAGTWGDVPVDATTQHVDASYAGTDSDGSPAKPWKTIQEGIDAAASGAIVAVAEGSYAEDLLIVSGAVRLWGRCPDIVEIVGSTAGFAAVLIQEQVSSGTEVRDIAIRGAVRGVALSGSEDVVLDRVWIHDAGLRGLVVQPDLGPTSISLGRSLLESNADFGIFIAGVGATIETTVVRDTQPGENGQFGRGVGIQADANSGEPASVTIRGSLVEQNHEVGVFVVSSDVTIESTAVRDTQPRAADQLGGRGVLVQAAPGKHERASLTLHGSVVERNHEIGVVINGSDATIESTVVRDTQPEQADLAAGVGVLFQVDEETGQRAAGSVRGCLVERNLTAGVSVIGADATIEATIIRDHEVQASDQQFGRGINLQDDPDTAAPASATVRGSVIVRNRDVGVISTGAELTVDATLIQDTTPESSEQRFGVGIHAQNDPDTGRGSIANVRACVVERSYQAGVGVAGSSVTLEWTAIRDVQPLASSGNLGDGVAIDATSFLDTSVSITASVVAGGARAGVATFGAPVSIGQTKLDCNAIHLDGENPYPRKSFSLVDQGGNACGCAGEVVVCKVLSDGLQPPEELPTE